MTAAVVFSGPVALADGITVNPSSVHRGDDVTISGAGCMGGVTNPDTGVTITSKPLKTVQDSVTQGRFSATTTVRWDARFGRFTVQAICKPNGHVLTGSVFVRAGGGGRHDDNGRPGEWPRTGGGGMAAAAESGSPLGMTAIAGGVLLAGALGFGAVTLVRSRARGRG